MKEAGHNDIVSAVDENTHLLEPREDLVLDSPVMLIKSGPLFPHHPSIASLWRAASERGVRGCRLETCWLGGRRFTSRRWIGQFLDDLNRSKRRVGFRTPSARARALRAAERRLAASGI